MPPQGMKKDCIKMAQTLFTLAQDTEKMRIVPTGKEAQCVSARVCMHIPTSVASMISN